MKKKISAAKDRTPVIFGRVPSTVPTKFHARNCEIQNPQAAAMAMIVSCFVNPLNFVLMNFAFMPLNCLNTLRLASRLLAETHHFLLKRNRILKNG
jgi:hypothetical protein